MKSNATAFRYRSAQANGTAGENSATVMQPDVLASAQYVHDRRAKTLEPEKSLMLAILEDAVHCFQANHRARCGNAKRTFDEAHSWLFRPSSDWVFSFENVCTVLGFDPQYIRRGLKNWKEGELAKHCVAPLWKPAALRSGTHG